MLLVMIMIFLFICITMIFLMINFLISKKMSFDNQKLSSFECGLDPLSSSRLPFSINFYLFGILFLIFDVEVVFLFPMIDSFECLNLDELMYISFMILLVLFLGLEFEKKEGSLKWLI